MAVRSRVLLAGVALLAGVGVLAACSSGDTAGPAGTTPTLTTPIITTPTDTTPTVTTPIVTTPIVTTAIVTTAQAPVSTAMSETAGKSAGPSPAPATETNPAGDIPDTQAFVDYTPTEGGYTVQVPEGWARTGTAGTATLFSDKYNSIRIDAAAAPTAPTVVSGQAELITIGSAATGFTPGKVTTEQRKAGQAVLITYQADSAPSSVTGKVISQDVQRYEFWNKGKTVTLTLSAPVGSDNVDPWRTVTDSFRWSA